MTKLTLPSTKVRGFSDYAQPIGSRWRLKGLPDPIKKFLCFIGSDFTLSPKLSNHQPKLLKSRDRPALSLFYFYRYRSTRIVKNIKAYFRRRCKPYRASPDSSPALKCGVFSGDFYNTEHSRKGKYDKLARVGS